MGFARVRFGPFAFDQRASVTVGDETGRASPQQPQSLGELTFMSTTAGATADPRSVVLRRPGTHKDGLVGVVEAVSGGPSSVLVRKLITKDTTSADVFMSGATHAGVATICGPDGSVTENVPETVTSLLPYNRLVISAVEQDNGTAAAPGVMGTITVYGLFGCNYKDNSSKNVPTAFAGSSDPWTHGGFQQATIGTLTRAEPVLVWDDAGRTGAGDVLGTVVRAGTAGIDEPLPFLHGLRLEITGSPSGVFRVYIDAERRF